MSTEANGNPAHEEHLDDDLRRLRDRLAARGVEIRLPTARSDYRLPVLTEGHDFGVRPVKVKGEPLSETVIRMRRGTL